MMSQTATPKLWRDSACMSLMGKTATCSRAAFPAGVFLAERHNPDFGMDESPAGNAEHSGMPAAGRSAPPPRGELWGSLFGALLPWTQMPQQRAAEPETLLC
mmetsp:Transcript_16447/g.36784  ORF Transcript_16447/g.36784 Transcript_16447/m.36784 type:complete len:102 (+) Transcript_16447:89-394(+)